MVSVQCLVARNTMRTLLRKKPVIIAAVCCAVAVAGAIFTYVLNKPTVSETLDFKGLERAYPWTVNEVPHDASDINVYYKRWNRFIQIDAKCSLLTSARPSNCTNAESVWIVQAA
jgi:hypothetical protein